MSESIASIADSGRFAPITDDDHSGFLWIACILCLIYSLLIIAVRLNIKWNMYGADDIAASMATVMQIGQVVPLFIAMQHGLGKSQDSLEPVSIDVDDVGKAIFASQIFLVLSLALAKGSIAALMLRLFTRHMEVTRKSWTLCSATIVLICAWGIGSIIAISVSCTPSHLIDEDAQRCSFQVTRWRIITAFNIFIEMVLMLLPILFIWPVQMKRCIKFQVVIAFGVRLPVIGFAAAHLHYVSNYTHSADASKAIIPALLYQQFELFWSLLAATIPTLKAFMRSFNSGFGMEIDLDAYGYGSGSQGYHNGSFPLQSLQNRSRTKEEPLPVRRTGGKKPVRNNTTASVMSDGSQELIIQREVPSVVSDGSQELVIQKEVQWSVYTEEASKGS